MSLVVMRKFAGLRWYGFAEDLLSVSDLSGAPAAGREGFVCWGRAARCSRSCWARAGRGRWTRVRGGQLCAGSVTAALLLSCSLKNQ